MKKKARSRIITFWKTEGEKIVFLSFVPNRKYTGSYIRILAPSTFFFRHSFLIHYRFPRKRETGSRWLRSINYIFVPYLHDRGSPYLSPLSIPYSLEITLIKKFWYTVESIRFLYHWKGWEEGGYGRRTNLYESNKTMFRNKKERARGRNEANFSKNPWYQVKGSWYSLIENVVYYEILRKFLEIFIKYNGTLYSVCYANWSFLAKYSWKSRTFG